MFTGPVAQLHSLFSPLWIPGLCLSLFSAACFFSKRENLKRPAFMALQGGCLLLALAFAWLSLDNILWGIMTDNQATITMSVFRYLIVIFPVLFIEIILFLRYVTRWWWDHPETRVFLCLLGAGLLVGFYASIIAYTLADMDSITNCIYVASPEQNKSEVSTWARDICTNHGVSG